MGAGPDDRADDASDSEEQWRFSVDDFPDPETAEAGTENAAEVGTASENGELDGQESNVTGTLERRQPLEPGEIDPENALFVALGVLLVVGLVVGAVLGL